MITTKAVVEIEVSTNDKEILRLFEEDESQFKKHGLETLGEILLENFDIVKVLKYEMYKNEVGEDAQ